MSVYKDEKTNTWKVYYRYTDWQGKVHQTTKRGFQTKREALAREREQLNKVETDLDMSLESFIDIYTADMKNRIKENTWHTKDHIIRTKILPYFGQRKISDIQPKDIIAWQNEMIKATDKQGKPYSPVHLQPCNVPFSGSNKVWWRVQRAPFQRCSLPLGERKTCLQVAFLIGLPVIS